MHIRILTGLLATALAALFVGCAQKNPIDTVQGLVPSQPDGAKRVQQAPIQRSELLGRWKYTWESMVDGAALAKKAPIDRAAAELSAKRTAARSAVAFTKDERQVTTFFERRTDFRYGYVEDLVAPKVTIKHLDGTQEETLVLAREDSGRWVLRRNDGSVRLYRE